jgi:tetratricopeptide (TPR) repeat protein
MHDMAAERESDPSPPTANSLSISNILRTFGEQSEAEKPFVPLVGGPRFFVLLLYASVLVAVSLEFFVSQRIWYGSWEVYNTYVFTVTGAFVLIGMVMLLSSKTNGEVEYKLPIPRPILGILGFAMFSLSGFALVYWGKSLEGWAILLSVTLLYGFLLMLLGGRGFGTKETLRLMLYSTGIVIMVLVPVHEAFGYAQSTDYPFNFLNIVLLVSGMSFALVAIQTIETRDGFVGAWLIGAMAIFLLAFHEQIGIVASGNYSPYDRTLAFIGIAFSFLPLVMYVWRERVYIFLWRRLRTANTLIEQGDYASALKQSETAIRQCSRVGIEDRFALPWSLKADALYRMKEYQKAMVHYDTALKIDPRDSTSWCHMGNMYAFDGKQEAALKAFDEALKVDPINGYAWNNKGTVYQTLKMYEDALICFDKAISHMQDPFDAHLNAARLFSKLGHSSDALQHYQAALDLRPKSEQAGQGMHKEFFRGMCMDQIAGWEQLGLDTSQLKQLLDQDPTNFVKRSKEFLKNIVEQKTELQVLPGKEHIDINSAIQAILKATEEPHGATVDSLKEATSLRERDLVLPLAILMETEHVHFKMLGKQQLYVSRGKAPERPPEPKPKPVKEDETEPKGMHATRPGAKAQLVQIKCPGCGQPLAGSESKCSRCDLPFETASFDCPICGEDVQFSADSCPKCGAVFKAGSEEALARTARAQPATADEAVQPKEKSGLWPRGKRGKRSKPKKPKEPEEKQLPKRRAVVTVEPTASVLVFRRRPKK